MSNQHPPPTLRDVLDAHVGQALSLMNCVSIGTIQAFTAANQTATVSINYRRILKEAIENVDGTFSDKIIPYPLLVQVPVMFLSGGVSRLTFPIAVGDTCILLFCDRELDTWFTSGNIDKPPATSRVHDLSDAIALVGIKSLANPLPDFNTLITSFIDKTGERLSQAGDVKATARTTAPSGWLLCYGQAISRTTYDILFTAIGTTYGSGDGSTTFNLPDLRGRTIVGLDNMGGSQAGRLTSEYTPNRNALGGAVGEETHLHGPGSYYLPNNAYGDYNVSCPVNYINTSHPSINLGAIVHTMAIAGNSEVKDKLQPGMMLNWIIKI